MEIQMTKPLRTMTAAELAECRERRVPLHCQTMCRRTRAGTLVYTDVEELTRETLEQTIHSLGFGWMRDGCVFVRSAGKGE